MKKGIIFIVALVLIGLVYFLGFNDTGDVVYDKDIIIVPVSVHLVDDGTVQYKTERDLDDIARVFDEVNRIWGQAQIEFIVAEIDTVEIGNKEFNSVFSGNVEVLTQRDDFVRGRINGYFARYINVNGISFPPQGFFVVGDITSVNDYRATSHELGHLFGLRHTSESVNRLMYQGRNGEMLNQDEVDIARRNARRVFEVEI